MRNTDLLQISVFSVDPQEAADIANKIVAVYQDKRVEEEKDILNRAVTTMNEEVAKQQKAVADAGIKKSLASVMKSILSISIPRAKRIRRRRLTPSSSSKSRK